MNKSLFIFKKLLNHIAIMSWMIIHYNYFVFQFYLFIQILKKSHYIYYICSISDMVKYFIPHICNSADNGHIWTSLFWKNITHWKNILFRLPNSTLDFPNICWSFIHINYFFTFINILGQYLNENQSLFS